MATIGRAGIDPNHHKGLVAVDDVTGEPFAVQGDAATGAINIAGTITAASDGAIVDGVSSSIKATVFDYTSSNPLAVRLTDTNGDYIAAGAGTQYTEDAAAAANPVGTALNLVRDDSRSGSITSADGDNIAARGTNAGEVYVKHVDSIAVTNAGLTELAAAVNASSQVDVNIAAGNITGFATSAKQDTIIGHLDGVEGLLTTIDADTGTLAGAVSGTEVQVDVVAALPAGTNAIGKLAANSGVDIGDVTLTAGTEAVGKLLPPDVDVTAHTNYAKKYYTNAGAVTDGIIWSPAAGKRWHVVSMFINVSAAATITLEDDKSGGDEAVMKMELAANSGTVINFGEKYPLASGEDAADLIITTSAGNVYVTITGYEI